MWEWGPKFSSNLHKYVSTLVLFDLEHKFGTATRGGGAFLGSHPHPHPRGWSPSSPKFLGPQPMPIWFGMVTCSGRSTFLEGQIQPMSQEVGPSVHKYFCDFLHMWTQHEKQQPKCVQQSY